MNPEELNQTLNRYSVEINGVRLCVHATAQTGKPLLYCVHGGPGMDSTSLIPGLIPLSRIFDLRFVDLRGNGGSTDPLDGDYSLDAMTKDLLQLINAENPKRILGIIGHSFGGLVATRVLAESPRLSFGILCSAPFDTEYQKEFSDALERAEDAETSELLKDFNVSTATDRDYRDLCIGLRSYYFPELDRESSLSIMNTWTYRVKPYQYAERLIFTGFNLEKEVREISAPTLVIGGDQDPLITSRYLTRYRSLTRTGEVEFINGAGHFPFLTQPEQFFTQVSQWWELNQPNLEGGRS